MITIHLRIHQGGTYPRTSLPPAAGLLLGLAVAFGGPACQQPDREPGRPIHSVWESPPAESPAARAETPPAPEPVGGPATQPGAAPDVIVGTPGGRPIASVNGEPIDRTALVDALLESHGLDMLEKLIVTAALRQKAQAAGIAITNADVQAEYDDALRRISAPLDPLTELATRPATEPPPFDRTAAEGVLNEFLVSKNISRSEFMMRMQQNAYLRKLADREVKVDDAQLPEEYRRAYGEKVQVRCIQVGSPEAMKRVRAALDEKKDFELVARQMSENRVVAARGGLLPPFTRYDDVPRLLRDAAFALQPGQVSTTIHENNLFFVLKLEKRFPPSEVGVENVKDDLRRRIKDRLVRERMDTLAGEVFRAAAIEINDAALREAFRKRYPDARPGGR